MPSAKWDMDAIIGCATFRYVAHDVMGGNLVYLKDCWCIDHPDAPLPKEGDE
jgi:hypothetical protein